MTTQCICGRQRDDHELVNGERFCDGGGRFSPMPKDERRVRSRLLHPTTGTTVNQDLEQAEREIRSLKQRLGKLRSQHKKLQLEVQQLRQGAVPIGIRRRA